MACRLVKFQGAIPITTQSRLCSPRDPRQVEPSIADSHGASVDPGTCTSSQPTPLFFTWGQRCPTPPLFHSLSLSLTHLRQALMCEPVPDDPLDAAIAEQWKTNTAVAIRTGVVYVCDRVCVCIGDICPPPLRYPPSSIFYHQSADAAPFCAPACFSFSSTTSERVDPALRKVKRERSCDMPQPLLRPRAFCSGHPPTQVAASSE
jgi:hypothetical protein